MTPESSRTPPADGERPLTSQPAALPQSDLSRLLALQSLYQLIGDQAVRVEVPRERTGEPANMPVGMRFGL